MDIDLLLYFILGVIVGAAFTIALAIAFYLLLWPKSQGDR